jgi:hypothetical protein
MKYSILAVAAALALALPAFAQSGGGAGAGSTGGASGLGSSAGARGGPAVGTTQRRPSTRAPSAGTGAVAAPRTGVGTAPPNPGSTPFAALPAAPGSGGVDAVAAPPTGTPGSEANPGAGIAGLGAGAGTAGAAGTGLPGQAGLAEPVRSPSLDELDRKNERIRNNTMRSICRGC